LYCYGEVRTICILFVSWRFVFPSDFNAPYRKLHFTFLGISFAVCTIKSIAMGIWHQIAQYLFLKKKDKDEEPGSLIKYMHGINRISIFLFLLAIIVMVIRFVKSC
jgi:Ni,Fe-hydrogenase I cytochrome b subunit